jgi:hypothetical protein
MGATIIIASVGSQYHPTPTPSPYVEVDYKTVGWYYTYPISNNQSCVVLNLTVTNKGYAESVEYNWNWTSMHPNCFSLNISSVVGTPVFDPFILIANSSNSWGYSAIWPSFSYAELSNGSSDNGRIIFEFPKQQYNQPFTLRCFVYSVTGIHKTINVKISGS